MEYLSKKQSRGERVYLGLRFRGDTVVVVRKAEQLRCEAWPSGKRSYLVYIQKAGPEVGPDYKITTPASSDTVPPSKAPSHKCLIAFPHGASHWGREGSYLQTLKSIHAHPDTRTQQYRKAGCKRHGLGARKDSIEAFHVSEN